MLAVSIPADTPETEPWQVQVSTVKLSCVSPALPSTVLSNSGCALKCAGCRRLPPDDGRQHAVLRKL